MKYLSFIAALLLLACANEATQSSKPEAIENQEPSGVQKLQSVMTGYYNSARHAAMDTNYFDISLTMVPIWEGNRDTCWLYVEQSLTSKMKSPYRQRVYRLTQEDAVTYGSAVYELDSAQWYVHSWNNLTLFNDITPADLIEREGCTVYLREAEGMYLGKTIEGDCKSEFGGAVYATSKVEVTNDKVQSWDQGWDAEGNQVWGAEYGPYDFRKITTRLDTIQ